MLNEYTPEQIAALSAGFAALIGALAALARRSAAREPDPVRTSAASSLLVLDAEQARALASSMGLVTVEMVGLGKCLQAHTQAVREAKESVDEATDEIRALTREIIRGQQRT